LAALVLTVGLLLPARGSAGAQCGPADGRKPACPQGSYSPLHYWAPAVFEARACLRPLAMPLWAPGYSPVPPHYQIIKYPCPMVDPATLYRERYLLR
jgi:hypothetical protein